VNTFASRVIRDEQFKVWVSEEREITALYDLMADPMEENNLIGSKEASHQSALKEFREVVTSMPEKDARPDYSPRAANPWDRKH
ncbi:MAG: N-acetylgalactosamine 6-sulfate sulfatase, partial [Opitutales bacterium]